MRRGGSFWGTLLRLPSALAEEKRQDDHAYEVLEILGLASFAEQKSSSLPYGAQRRLEIARALAAKPRVLLLDEPAAGMNSAEKESTT
jgi:branched-chain amino acid transport system ATP-binding protein